MAFLTIALQPAPAPAIAWLSTEGEVFLVAIDEARAPDVAMRSDGSFVVVWARRAFPSTDIRARIYGPGNDAAGETIEVGGADAGWRENPSVAMSNDGEFLVAWTGDFGDVEYGALARLFDRNGAPSGPQFPLDGSGATAASAHHVDASRDGDGYAVAWVRDGGVDGVRLDATGEVRGSFTREVADAHHVAVDGLPGGDLALLWSSNADAQLTEEMSGRVGMVHGAVLSFDSSEKRSFRANEGRLRYEPDYVVDGDERLSVAGDASGAFTAVYDSTFVARFFDDEFERNSLGTKVERFDLSARTLGSFFLDDVSPRGATASVAMTPGGNSVAAFWTYDDYYDNGVWIRSTDCHGELGAMLRVNGDVAEGVRHPSVAINERGDGVVVWTEVDPDTDEDVLLARRFRLEYGCSLCGDANADGEVTAMDALRALRSSVGTAECAQERCDTNGSGKTGSADALRILRAAVAGGTNLLRCSSAPIAEHVGSGFLPAEWESFYAPALVSGDGEALLVYSPSGYQAVHDVRSQAIDDSLEVGQPQIAAPAPLDGFRANASACVGVNGLVTAWTSHLSELASGITLDSRNVELTVGGKAGIVANTNAIGWQSWPSVACLSGGRYAVSWSSYCTVVERTEDFVDYYRSDLCDDEPADGVYFQMFESDGTKLGPMRFVSGSNNSTHVAALDGDRFAIVAGAKAEVRSSDGELIGSIDIPENGHISGLECLGTLCARANYGQLQLFDAGALQSFLPIVVRGRNFVGTNRVIEPYGFSFACEPGGTCLAAWTLWDVHFDAFRDDYPGVYARPFDLKTGKVGEEIRLQHGVPATGDALVASVGPRGFVVAVQMRDGYALHRVSVQ
jgi:hypothetical protein